MLMSSGPRPAYLCPCPSTGTRTRKRWTTRGGQQEMNNNGAGTARPLCRLIINKLSRPGLRVAISSSTTFSSIRAQKWCACLKGEQEQGGRAIRAEENIDMRVRGEEAVGTMYALTRGGSGGDHVCTYAGRKRWKLTNASSGFRAT